MTNKYFTYFVHFIYLAQNNSVRMCSTAGVYVKLEMSALKISKIVDSIGNMLDRLCVCVCLTTKVTIGHLKHC